MTELGTFRSSTFKPTIDKWIAKDGVPVVLWNDGDELLVLHYADREWTIATHGRVAAEASGSLFRGYRYAQRGQPLLRLCEAASDAEWAAAYDEYFERQTVRLRSQLCEPDSALAAV